MNSEEILSVRNLSFLFRDGAYGLKNVNFSVHEGEFLVIAGLNGSGKTLLMKHLNGLLRPSSGNVLYRGTDIVKDLRLVRRKIGLVFQDADSQIVGQTVREDVEFGPENLGLTGNEITILRDAALVRTGLSTDLDARARSLSGGEKRLLAVTGVLAMDPEILVFDEPFANLDFPAVRRILNLILELNAGGKTILLITHELEKTLAHAGRLMIMKSGEVIEDGPAEKLFSSRALCDLVPPHILEAGFKAMTW